MADFYAEALAAARAGDEKTAREKLAARAEKMNSPTYTGNGGGTSMEAATAEVNRILKEAAGTGNSGTLTTTGGTSAVSASAGAVTSGSKAASPYAGTNYHQNAIDAAKRGDWAAVKKYLALREEKTAYEGDNRGKSSVEIYQELWDQYGASDEQTLAGNLAGIYGEDGLYAQALKNQQAANDAAVEKAVASLEGQKEDTNQSYANLFRQLYIDKMKSKKNIDQRMAAQGVTGGAAESTLLGLNTSYEEALRQGEQERIGTLGDLDQAITDTRLTGDITNAEAAAANARERGAGYASVLQGLLSQEYSRTNTEKANARQTALAILQTGNMASEELLEAAGISSADAAAIVAAANTSKQETASATDREYAYELVLAMLQGGDMPSEDLLNAAGISYADAYTIRQRAQSNLNKQQASTGAGTPKVEDNGLFEAIAALSKMSGVSITADQAKALWNGGYRFENLAPYLPALQEQLGTQPEPEVRPVVKEVMAEIEEGIEIGGYTNKVLVQMLDHFVNNGRITGDEAAEIATKYKLFSE